MPVCQYASMPVCLQVASAMLVLSLQRRLYNSYLEVSNCRDEMVVGK